MRKILNIEELGLLRLMRIMAGGKGHVTWSTLMKAKNRQEHYYHPIMLSLQRKGKVKYRSEDDKVYLLPGTQGWEDERHPGGGHKSVLCPNSRE